MYKVIPISSDGGYLSVGMLNPCDKSAISNIIHFTGQKPVIFIITICEYMNLIKKFFE